MSRKKKAQIRVINEIQNQLLVQAERLGIRDYYTPLKMIEIDVDSVKKIYGELLAEKANLEYELHVFGSNKKELLIKLERLNSYIRKAEVMKDRYEKSIEKMLDKLTGDKTKMKRALSKVKELPKISILVGNN